LKKIELARNKVSIDNLGVIDLHDWRGERGIVKEGF
jgi:hypothetical protein